MRNLSVLALILFLFADCKKKDQPFAPNQQIVIKTFDNKTVELKVDTKQGYVTLNIEDLPDNINEEDLSPLVGTVPFNTHLSISSIQATPGNYTIKLVSFKDGLTDSVRITPVDLVVEPFSESECNSFFKSITSKTVLSVQDSAGTLKLLYDQPTITLDDGQLTLNNLVLIYQPTFPYAVTKSSAANQKIPFTINCETGTLTIPPTTVKDKEGKSYEVSGTGSINYTAKTFVITYKSNNLAMRMNGHIDYNAYFEQ